MNLLSNVGGAGGEVLHISNLSCQSEGITQSYSTCPLSAPASVKQSSLEARTTAGNQQLLSKPGRTYSWPTCDEWSRLSSELMNGSLAFDVRSTGGCRA